MILREGVKAGSARRAKDERIGGFHPVASREAALAGAARLGVRRLDAALARWEKGVAGFRARRVKAGSARRAAEGERVLLPDCDEIRDRAAEGAGRV